MRGFFILKWLKRTIAGGFFSFLSLATLVKIDSDTLSFFTGTEGYLRSQGANNARHGKGALMQTAVNDSLFVLTISTQTNNTPTGKYSPWELESARGHCKPPSGMPDRCCLGSSSSGGQITWGAHHEHCASKLTIYEVRNPPLLNIRRRVVVCLPVGPAQSVSFLHLASLAAPTFISCSDSYMNPSPLVASPGPPLVRSSSNLNNSRGAVFQRYYSGIHW